MKMNKQTVKNHFGKAVMIVAIALMALACKDNEDEQVQLQTVEFTFGPGYMDEVYPATNVAKAGADKNVGKIKIKSNGQDWRGFKVSDLANTMLAPVFAAANGKGTGDKTKLMGVQIDNKADSTRLADVYGYVFENCYVPSN